MAAGEITSISTNWDRKPDFIVCGCGVDRLHADDPQAGMAAELWRLPLHGA